MGSTNIWIIVGIAVVVAVGALFVVSGNDTGTEAPPPAASAPDPAPAPATEAPATGGAVSN